MWRLAAGYAINYAEELRGDSPIVVGVAKSKAVFDWPWKLVQNDGAEGDLSRLQLFNVADDPLETTDTSNKHPDRFKRLADQLQSLPKIPSKGARGPKPETLFRDESGSFVYDIRKPETREPWAESAKED